MLIDKEDLSGWFLEQLSAITLVYVNNSWAIWTRTSYGISMHEPKFFDRFCRILRVCSMISNCFVQDITTWYNLETRSWKHCVLTQAKKWKKYFKVNHEYNSLHHSRFIYLVSENKSNGMGMGCSQKILKKYFPRAPVMNYQFWIHIHWLRFNKQVSSQWLIQGVRRNSFGKMKSAESGFWMFWLVDEISVILSAPAMIFYNIDTV